VDGRQVFVGSFNFDPRSVRLNTEMGLVIDSAPLAQQMAGWFDTQAPLDAYEVRLGADGQSLEWIERLPSGEEKRFTTEPGTSAFKRFGVEVLSVLPIEWLL
jgi:putative cardiolipin synthase